MWREELDRALLAVSPRDAGRMIFANDHLLSREVRSQALARQGVIWKPIEEASSSTRRSSASIS